MIKKLETKEDVYELLSAPTASAAFRAAIETGLLWMLVEEPMEGERVSRALNIPGRRGYYWLQYLESLGILEKDAAGYVPSNQIRSLILETYSRESWQHLAMDERERDACVLGLSQLIQEPGSLWAAQGLPEPENYVDKMRASPERAREFTRMLFEVHQKLAEAVAERLDLSGVEHMMDLGGNSGVVSMALLRKYPTLTSTIVYIENVCIAGREIVAEQGFFDRITYHPAEFSKDEFPSGFDLVLQCDVAVFDLALIQKIYRSLKPDGRLVFIEHFSPSENTAPPRSLEWIFLDSLRDPDFHYPTVDEYTGRLGQAGCEVCKIHEPFGSGWIVIEAQKRAEP